MGGGEEEEEEENLLGVEWPVVPQLPPSPAHRRLRGTLRQGASTAGRRNPRLLWRLPPQWRTVTSVIRTREDSSVFYALSSIS